MQSSHPCRLRAIHVNANVEGVDTTKTRRVQIDHVVKFRNDTIEDAVNIDLAPIAVRIARRNMIQVDGIIEIALFIQQAGYVCNQYADHRPRELVDVEFGKSSLDDRDAIQFVAVQRGGQAKHRPVASTPQ